MENKVYKEANEKIDIAIMQREEQKNILEKAIEDNRTIVKKASEAMTNATIASNLKSYKEAKEKRNEARDAIELYEARAAHLKKQAYVSDDEGKEIAKQINDEQKKVVLEAIQKIGPLLKQIDEIGMQTFNIVDQGNELIKKWHTKVVPFKVQTGWKGNEPWYTMEAPLYYAKELRSFIAHIKAHKAFYEITKQD